MTGQLERYSQQSLKKNNNKEKREIAVQSFVWLLENLGADRLELYKKIKTRNQSLHSTVLYILTTYLHN